MNGLAIPEPKELSPVRLNELCTAAEAWASTTDSIAAIRDTVNKFDAIARYMQLTATDNLAEVEATKRRLEVRIGQLLGPAPTPHESGARKGSLTNEPSGELTPNQRHDFRQMAENPDIVDDIINQSDDHNPPSRRKVTDEIKRRKRAKAQPPLNPNHEEERQQRAIETRNQSFRLALESFTRLPPPDEFADQLTPSIARAVDTYIDDATEWLNQLHETWTQRQESQ